MIKDNPLSFSLKQVMRRVPYPVTIITASFEGDMRGITIGSFTSLSLEPPLICFNVGKESQMHSFISKANHFAVHIPHREQEGLCNLFAKSDMENNEQFAKVNYELHDLGMPLIGNVCSILICKSFSLVEAGDHSLVIGEIIEAEQYRDDPAILYYNGKYYALDEEEG